MRIQNRSMFLFLLVFVVIQILFQYRLSTNLEKLPSPGTTDDAPHRDQKFYPSLLGGDNLLLRERAINTTEVKSRIADNTELRSYLNYSLLFDPFSLAKNDLLGSSIEEDPKKPQPFFLCTAPKTGSTGWTAFFLWVNERILAPTDKKGRLTGKVHLLKGNSSGEISTIVGMPVKKWPHDEASNNFLQTWFHKVDRFVITRNPYVRFVSSFLDWQKRGRNGGERAKEFVMNTTFEEFIDLYENRAFDEEKNFYWSPFMYTHIDSVSRNCGFDKVGGYTAALRLEEQALWLDSLFEKYGLEDHYQRYRASGGAPLFQNSVSSNTKLIDVVFSSMGKKSWVKKAGDISNHHFDSSNKMFEYYNKPELVDKVSKLLWDDFIHFQYPLWDGNPKSFRFV